MIVYLQSSLSLLVIFGFFKKETEMLIIFTVQILNDVINVSLTAPGIAK